MTTQATSIHLRSLAVNAANISTETIDGDEHTVIRGVVPVVDDVVMNGGLYPASEINSSFQSIEGNLMPLSHPRVDGRYVSANDPRAVNKFYAGAWAENVRKEGERVVMDVKVNRRVAAANENGQRLLDRLDAMAANTSTDPIHISTGLLLNKEQGNGQSKGKKYNWIARNMRFDHVAILLDEPGAATPDEGVGIFVNADGSETDVELAALETEAEQTTDETAFNRLVNKLTAFFSANHKPQEDIDPMKNMIINALKAKGVATDGLNDEQLFAAYNAQFPPKKEDEKPDDADPAKKKKPQPQDDAQNSQAPAWFAPFAEKLTAMETTLTANANQELDTKRAAVKAKFGWTDAAVNSLQGEALDNLYASTQTAAPLFSGFNANANNASDNWKDYDLNASMETK
ncbi:DUF2213 domain-containing protein [Escherichia coli]|nr:DUF2213 domain-containing protein [Escherichia coli]